MTEFSLVVPTYNEAANILTLLKRVEESLRGKDYEIWVVDDDSPDKTWELAEAYGRRHPEVRVLRRPRQRGLSSAVIAGFRQSRGKHFGVIDADLSHDARILPELLQAVEQGAEVAVGSRRVPGGGIENWPWYRRMGSRLATALAQGLLGLSLRDPMSGYFVLRRDVFDRSADRLRPAGYKILLEILMKAGVGSVVEIPFTFKDREQGDSKVSGRVMLDYLGQLLRLRWALWTQTP